MPGDRNDSLYERLKRAYVDEEPKSLEVLRSEVAELGYDPSAVAARGFEMFDIFLKKQQGLQARAKLDAIRTAVEGFRFGIDRSLEGAKRKISEALAFGGDELAVQASYQKLTSIDAEDLLSLEDDVALLEFIEELEGREES